MSDPSEERTNGRINVGSLYGLRTREPLVSLQILDLKPVLLGVDEARDLARSLVEAAEAAEGDAFVFEWTVKTLGATPEQGSQILVEFRQARKERGS